MSACHKSWLFLAQMQHPPVSQVETKEWRCAELHGYMNTRINSTGPPHHQCEYHQLDQSKINDGHFSNESVNSAGKLLLQQIYQACQGSIPIPLAQTPCLLDIVFAADGMSRLLTSAVLHGQSGVTLTSSRVSTCDEGGAVQLPGRWICNTRSPRPIRCALGDEAADCD